MLLWLFNLILLIGGIESFDESFYIDKNPCEEMNTIYVCQKPGLIRLPDVLKNGTETVIIKELAPRNSVLGPGNFTKYPKELIKMTITSSGISRIDSETFTVFKEIPALILMMNKIKFVDSKAFSGIKIEELDLSHNEGIKFHQDAFKDARINKLTLKSCVITSLPFATFRPLFRNGLKEAHFEQNQLTEIDPDFYLEFLKLSTLNLVENPIHCKCSMKWFLSLPKSIINQNIKLKCAEPASMVDLSIANLSPEDFDCSLPRVEKIHMDLNYNEIANKLSIDLKCQAYGTRDLKLKLVRSDDPENVLKTSIDAKTVSLSMDQPDHVPMFTYGGDRIYDDEGRLKMEPFKPERFTCLVEDLNGNVSTDLIVKWPRISDRSIQLEPERIMESQPEGEFFLKKKFTILEMIGAVIGTFATTIFAFICLYCVRYDSIRGCYLSCCQYRSTRDHKMFKNTSSLNNAQILKDTNLTTGLLQYQNSNATSNGGLPFAPMNQLLMAQGYPSSGSDDTNNNTNSSSSGYELNANATLNKRSSYATYDALSGQNNGQQGLNQTYNDCQTYDLPQNSNHLQIQAPTPLLPLPPLPREGPPTSNGVYSPQQGPFFDHQSQLQAALAVATLSRMQNPGGVVQTTQNQNIDVNLLQQQWNYLTMLQNANNSKAAPGGQK